MKVEHETRQPDGQPFPDPYYVMQTTDPNTPIRISFFYSALEAVKDLDQAIVLTKKFLDRHEDYFFSKDSEDGIQLIVRVLNPRNLKYKVFCTQNIKFSDGGRMDLHFQIAYSDMKYREFTQKLPTWEGMKEVTYSLEFADATDNRLITTGKFHYYVQ